MSTQNDANFPFFPTARSSAEDLVIQEIYDELVIYDLRQHRAHSLNSTAALVWRWCDGETSATAMTARLAARLNLPVDRAEPVVWLSLDRLQKARLLENSVAIPSAHSGFTRRQALKLIGGAVLLPVVYTLLAPTPAQAQTGVSCATCTCLSVSCSGGAKVACLTGTTCTCENNTTQCTNGGGTVCVSC